MITSAHSKLDKADKSNTRLWPSTLATHAIELTVATPGDTQALWPQLGSEDNAHLFEVFFGHPCPTVRALELFFEDESEGRSGTVSYLIHVKKPLKLIGWVTLYALDVESGLLEVAFFLPTEARNAIGARAFFLLCVHAFEALAFTRINFRFGSHEHGLDHNGLSLLAVLGRQLFVPEVKDIGYAVVTSKQWDVIKISFDAWETSMGGAGTV